MNLNHTPQGMTLVEMMVTIAILGIIAAMAAPSFTSALEDARLSGAAEAVYLQLQEARSEAVKRSTTVTVSFNTNTWCSGFVVGTTACNCTQTTTTSADYCGVDAGGGVLAPTSVLGSNYQGVTVYFTTFTDKTLAIDGVRGIPVALENGRIVLRNVLGHLLEIKMSALGRVMICDSTGTNTNNYKRC